jgi:hypothetical protein
MATALSYPTISGVSGAPYLSALSDTANIQDAINYLYYGSTKSTNTSNGIYGMLTNLQSQISAVSSGINVHESAKFATTTTLAATYAAGTTDSSGGTGINATITFSSTGVQKIDSTTVDLALNDRVLVKNGTTALSGTSSIANGIYYVSTAPAVGVAGILTRALDSDNSIAGEMAEGDFLYVSDGDTNANEGYILTTSSATGTGPAGSIKIGTDSVTYTQFVGVGSYYIGTTATQISPTSGQALAGIASVAMVSGGGGTFTLSPASSASSFAISLPATTGTVYVSTGTDVSLADGGTNASLTASNGGIVYSTASALAILSGTATAGQHLQSGSSTTPSWTTSTYADTYAANSILYASSANTVTGLALGTANQVLTVNSGGTAFSWATPSLGYLGTTQTTASSAGTSTLAGVNTFTPTATASIQPSSVATTPGIAVSLIAGATSLSSGSPVGGSVTITGGAQTNGSATGTGGAVTIAAGSGGAAGQGGSMTLDGGAGGTNGGGNITLRAGASASGNGSINIGTSNTDAITIGASSKTITLNGTVTLGTTGLVGPATMAAFNTVSTNLSIGGAATTLNLGASTGTLTIGNATITGTNATALNLNGATTITVAGSTATTGNLLNTTQTTLNIGGAATTLTLGNTATAAQTVSMFTASTGAGTYNFATGANTTASKTITIGNAGSAGTTNINIGTQAAAGTQNIFLNGNVNKKQTVNALNSSATVTAAFINGGIVTSTTAAAVTGTLDTGTNMDAAFTSLAVGMSIEWSVVNTGTNNFTVSAAASGHTVVGNMVVYVPSATIVGSGRFLSTRTGTATWITYRIA